MKNYHFLKKKFFFLIYFLLQVFCFADDWALATTAFSVIQNNVEVSSAIGELLPKLIMEQFSQNGVRLIGKSENLDRSLKSLQTERLSLFLQLSKEEKTRDSLIFNKNTSYEYKKALKEQNKKIQEIKDKINENLNKEKENLIENETYIEKTENVVFYKNDTSALFSPSQNSKSEGITSYNFEKEVLQAKINGLLTGNINLLGEYFSCTVDFYLFPGAKLSSTVMEVGSTQDLLTVASSIVRKLMPSIANSLPVFIDFEFESEEAFNEDEIIISIDGVISKTSKNILVDAGIHSIRISCSTFQTQNINYLFAGEEKFTVKTKLIKEKKGEFSLSLKKMNEGIFYYNGNDSVSFTENQENPSTVNINGKSILGVFTEKSGNSAFIRIPSNIIENNSLLTVNVKPFNREENIEKRRKRMYLAYSSLICSLPGTFYTMGNFNSVYLSYHNGQKSYNDVIRAQNAQYVSVSISAVTGIWFIFELIRYLKSANDVLPATAKK